jgi:hypothetical protein
MSLKNFQDKLDQLRRKLPSWTFERYGNQGAIACYPPGGPSFEAWTNLAKWATITSACGPLYVVTLWPFERHDRKPQRRPPAQWTNFMLTYFQQYLHVRNESSGQTWFFKIDDNEPLDLEMHINRWIAAEFGGELVLDPPLMPKVAGDYYARIMTAGRPPESVVCWQSGGFYLKGVQ